MLSPTPFSLFCAILICLPFALFFTLSPHSTSYPSLSFPHHHVSTTTLISPPPPKLINIPSFVRPFYIKTLSKEPTPPPPPKLINNQSSVKPSSVKILSKKMLLKRSIDSKSSVRPFYEKQKPPHVPENSTLPKHPIHIPRPPPPPPVKLIKRKKTPKTPYHKETPPKKQALTQIYSIPKIPLPAPIPPPSPPPEDEKDDVELLRRASRVNPNPIKGPKKLAFLFLTTIPLPFAPLWEKFFNQTEAQDRYNIYVHCDNIPSSKCTGIFQGRIIPSSKQTARNTPTLVAAARRLLAHALLHDPNNYMFTLLSPACIPLHSFNFTYTTLTSSNKSFIEILSNETSAYSRWAARGVHIMLPEIPLEVFRIGSQFWTLTRRHALTVVKDVKLWQKFRVSCINIGVCFPEENYFPTLLSLVDPQNVVPTTLTNVDWNGGSNGHPRVYNESENGVELIQRLRMARPRYGDNGIYFKERWDPFLFARKFGPGCLDVLLSLTNHVLFKD